MEWGFDTSWVIKLHSQIVGFAVDRWFNCPSLYLITDVYSWWSRARSRDPRMLTIPACLGCSEVFPQTSNLPAGHLSVAFRHTNQQHLALPTHCSASAKCHSVNWNQQGRLLILIACQLQIPSSSRLLFTADSFLTDRADVRSFFQSLSLTNNVPYWLGW